MPKTSNMRCVAADLTSSFGFASDLTKFAPLGVAQQMLDVTGQPLLHASLGLL
jgi:hypothetical protein